MRSIRERILKDLAGVGDDDRHTGCSEVDPGEDTESRETHPHKTGESSVAVRSIRERILKGHHVERDPVVPGGCSEVDPGEDTERVCVTVFERPEDALQ